MTDKLLAITNSTDLITLEYINKQLDAILNIYPGLEIEHVNENDPRLALYCKYPYRFPCYILFKNNTRKAVITAKLSYIDAISWVTVNLG